MAIFQATIDLLPGDALSRPLNPYNLGLYEQASVHSDGTNVTGHVVAPFQMFLVPNPALAIPSDSTNDFRVDIARTVTRGARMYTVEGRRMPDEGTSVRELIGELVADSECVPSQYGDEIIFFRQSVEQWRL